MEGVVVSVLFIIILVVDFRERVDMEQLVILIILVKMVLMEKFLKSS